MEKQTVNLDKVLDNFGVFHRYHLVLTACIWYAIAVNSCFWSNYIFTAEESGYRCKDINFGNDSCSTSPVKCSEWIYDDPNSFVAEFQLACQEWKRTLVGTMHNLGYVVGLVIVGPLSDRIGRKMTTIVTGVIGAFIGIVKSFVYSYSLYIVLEFLEAAIGDLYSPLSVLSIEAVSSKNRAMYYGITVIGYQIGNMLLPLAAWGVPYWRNFVRVIYAPGFLVIFYIYLMDESPRWLLVRGSKKKAVRILEKMSIVNRVQLDKGMLNELAIEKQEDNMKFFDLLKMTLGSRSLLKRFLICIVWWIASTFVNVGMFVNVVSLQGNKYINFFLISLVEVPATFILIYILAKYKRRSPLIMSFLVGAVLCIIQPFLPADLNWLQILSFMVSKLFAFLHFDISYVFTSELFPTYTRNSMHALCSAIGRTASIFAPQTPLLNAYWPGTTSVIFGALSVIAGLLTFFVPDTAGNDLPDTVDQAEVFEMKPPKEGILNLATTGALENNCAERNSYI